jgi:signal transduction histidine kinase
MSSKTFQAPEQLVPKLGDTLVHMGLLTDKDLQHALEVQHQSNSGKLLGEILIDLHYINQETLNAAVTEQIYLLKTKLQKANQDLEKRVKQRTIELEDALKKLSEITQLKANFIANISHELRTPLTHIIGYLELLNGEDLGSLTDSQCLAINTMIRSSSQLEKLINDLIMYTSMENNDAKLFLQTIDLSLIFSSIITKTKTVTQQQNIALISEIEENAALVEADQDKIQWVLMQLIENAIKFSPQGGNICLSARNEGNAVKVSVSDQGIGIPEDQFLKIFDAFYQIDGSSTRKFGGTGMGLSLVKKILSLHNTEIDVISQQKHGSEFSFLLQKPL